MSLPTEVDFALVKRGDGASTEVFSVLCGLTDVQINQRANSADRFVRDCAKPGEVPIRKTRGTGKMLDVTGSGLTNVDNIATLTTALGKVGNFKVELFADNGTDEGDLLGTISGAFRLNSTDLNIPRDGDASSQIALANHGAWTYAAAA
jgi:hypothetical protein